MVNKLVSIRVSNELIEETNMLVTELGFNNMQEFVRDAWRTAVEKQKLMYVKKELTKLYGCAKHKNIKEKTKKEIEEHIQKVFFDKFEK
ncbi:ribbon-helix-helix domain-containing protein [Candidatus Woesearchaeota archaeon]|nr:ribbon-helix-helix domain-containing protein [Candidatus Woesearchaeota archaeon]